MTLRVHPRVNHPFIGSIELGLEGFSRFNDQGEAPYFKTDSALARKKLRLRLFERADFQSILFSAVQDLAMWIFMSFFEIRKQ